MSSKGGYGDPTTRQRILDVAWKLIVERGAKVRLSDVAESAGVSRQAIYLHFGDRAGLLVAVVGHVDETLGLSDLFESVKEASTGADALARMIELHSIYTPKIDSIAQVLEAAQHEDAALEAAWRNRMEGRRRSHEWIIRWIADDGDLADGWTVSSATDLFLTVTMPGPWRELTASGWTAEEYTERITRLLERALIKGHSG